MKKASEYRAHTRERLSLSMGAKLDAQRSTLAKEGEHEEEGIAPPALGEEG